MGKKSSIFEFSGKSYSRDQQPYLRAEILQIGCWNVIWMFMWKLMLNDSNSCIFLFRKGYWKAMNFSKLRVKRKFYQYFLKVNEVF